MKNLSNYFNPQVKEIEFSIAVTIDVADQTGWEFSDYYESNRKKEWSEDGSKPIYMEEYSESVERIRGDNNYEIEVRIHGDKENPSVTYGHMLYPANCEVTEDTGDSEESIKDVINWIEKGTFERYNDCSVDENGNYMPTFAQFATMEDEKVGAFLVGKEIVKL